MKTKMTTSAFFIILVPLFVLFYMWTYSDSAKLETFPNYRQTILHNSQNYHASNKSIEIPPPIDVLSVCPKPNKRVLIAARGRTGSTFIGELFNQNPSIFYLFEPLRVITDMVKGGLISERYHSAMGTELVRSFCTCDFLTYYVYQIQRWNMAIHESLALRNICHSANNCQEVDVKYLKEMCLRFETMVMKSIRVDDVSSMFHFLTDPCFDLRIVFLVRDPRAVVSSRKYFNFNRTLRNESLEKLKLVKPVGDNSTDLHYGNVNDYCKWMSRNIALIRKAPRLAKERITIVRYEDVVANVTHAAVDLYAQLGIPMAREILRWIKEHTNAKTQPKKDVRGSMTMKRNSTSTSLAWRTDLNIADVRLVQGACRTAMELLDYEMIENEAELTDLSKTLFNPLSFEWD